MYCTLEYDFIINIQKRDRFEPVYSNHGYTPDGDCT